MQLSTWATILWTVGFGVNIILVLILLQRRRYRIVPWFFTWITAEAIVTVALFLVYRLGSRQTYGRLYWTADFLDVALQIAALSEIARYLLHRQASRSAPVRRFWWMVVLAIGGAATIAQGITPAAKTHVQAVLARSNLFTSVLVCLLLTALILQSQRLGLGLRSHVMRESYGFVIWSLTAFLTDSLHAYWRTAGHFAVVENIKIAVFQICLVYWCIAFWLPETKPKEPSPATRARLDDLVSKLEGAQPRRTSSAGDRK